MRAGSSPWLLAVPALVSLAWAPFYHDPEGIVAVKAGVLLLAGFLGAAFTSPARAFAVTAVACVGALACPVPQGAALLVSLGGAILAGITAWGLTRKDRVPLGILLAGLILAGILGAQRVLGLFAFLRMPETDLPSATFPNRNLLATPLAAALAVGCAWAISPRTRWPRSVRWASVFVLFAALLACKTEGALGGAVAALLFLLAIRAEPRWMAWTGRVCLGAAGAMLLAATLLLSFRGPDTLGRLPAPVRSWQPVVERVALWTIAGERLESQPFRPAGPGGFEDVRDAGLAAVLREPALARAEFVSPHAHNDWLQYAVEGTPLAAALGLVLFGLGFASGLRRLRGTPPGEERFALEASGAVITVVLVHSFVHFPLHLPTPLLFAGLSLGVLLPPGTGARPRRPRASGVVAVVTASLLAGWCAAEPVRAHDAFESGQRQAEARRFGEAAESFRKCVRLYPRWSLAWENLAAAQVASGELRLAEEAGLRAVQTGPHAATAWANLGGVRGLRGNLEGAEEAYRKALEWNPRLGAAQEGLRAVTAARRAGTSAR